MKRTVSTIMLLVYIVIPTHDSLHSVHACSFGHCLKYNENIDLSVSIYQTSDYSQENHECFLCITNQDNSQYLNSAWSKIGIFEPTTIKTDNTLTKPLVPFVLFNKSRAPPAC